ncbi:MAG: copper chaperone PCu(A)C [Thermomicrobiales bacterium]
MTAISRRGLVALLAAFVPASTPGPTLPPGIPMRMTITNTGDRPERLKGASTPVAELVELRARQGFGADQHEVLAEGGIVIPARSFIILESLGEYPAMLGMRRPLVQGETFPVVFRFEQAGEIAATGRVRRKLDAAGVAPIPPVTVGDITISLVSAPPSPAEHQSSTPAATPIG